MLANQALQRVRYCAHRYWFVCERIQRRRLAVIARLGGHLKHNGPPGWETLAAGYMHLLTFESGWLAAKSQPQI